MVLELMGSDLYKQGSRGYSCLHDWFIIDYIRRKEQEERDREDRREQPEISDLVDVPDESSQKREENRPPRGIVIIDYDGNDVTDPQPNNGVIDGIVISMLYR